MKPSETKLLLPEIKYQLNMYAEYAHENRIAELDVRCGANLAHDGLVWFSGDVSYDTLHCDMVAACTLMSDTAIDEVAQDMLEQLCEAEAMA